MYTQFLSKLILIVGCMENPERWNNPDQPEQINFCYWGHMQAAIIQNIKQDKPLSNYFTVLKHLYTTHLAVTWPRMRSR